MRVLKNNIFIFCGLIILAFLLFGNGINGEFVFDDRSVIVGNPLVEEFSGVFKAFLNPYHYARPQSGLYRPLTFASYVFDWHLFSGNPAGFHIVNIMFHFIASFLVYLVLKGSGIFFVTKKVPDPLLSSLLFLFLPIHVEAVTSIVGRGEILALLFFLSAFYSLQNRSYKIATIFFFLSLLSKETGIVFIPVFIFFEFFWRKTEWKQLIKKTAYFLPPLIVYAGLRYYALGSDYFISTNAYSFFNPIKEMDFFPGLRMAFKVLYLYVQKMIYPDYFSSDYSYNQISEVNNLFSSWQAMAGVVIFVALICLAILRRNNLVGLGAVIFLFSYLIVSNLFVKIGTIMAERLMYMHSLGLVILIATTVESLKFKVANYGLKSKILNPTHKFFIFYFSFLILLVWYGYAVIDRNRDWLNEKNLFESAYAVAPNSVVNITNMASILFREGKNQEALEKIQIALEIEPKNSPTLHLAGQIYRKNGEDKKAEESWLKAIQAQADYLYPYLSLGVSYYQKGDFKSGAEILLKAQEIYNTPNVISLLAFNKVGLEQYSEVISLVEKRFGKIPKEFELRFILGVAYLKSGNDSKANELLLELKDPTLSEEVDFFKNLRETRIFSIEI